MTDDLATKICCLPGQGIVGATNAVVTKLHPELRIQFNNVFSSYLHRYGIEGIFERMNDRTVGSILADFDPADDASLIEEGQIDGMRFRLYRRVNPEAKKNESP